jgi:hypothetical protein
MLEARAVGGQGGASARIENYLGFPEGISDRQLSWRACAQAQKFGAEMLVAAEAVPLEAMRPGSTARYRVAVRENEPGLARVVVIASGATYRRPDITSLDRFEGSGVHYWAFPVEAALHRTGSRSRPSTVRNQPRRPVRGRRHMVRIDQARGRRSRRRCTAYSGSAWLSCRNAGARVMANLSRAGEV